MYSVYIINHTLALNAARNSDVFLEACSSVIEMEKISLNREKASIKRGGEWIEREELEEAGRNRGN